MTRLLYAAVALSLVLLTACGGGAPSDPQQALVDALERTGDTSFAFALTADVQDGSSDPGATQGMAVLRSARLSGAHNDGAVSLTIQAMGFEFAELRILADESLFVRLNTQAIADLSGGMADPQQLLGMLPPGMPAEIRTFAEAALRGEWVGIEGAFEPPADAAMLPGDAPLSSQEAQALVDGLRERVGNLTRFVEDFASVSEVAAGDESARRFAVALDVEALVRAAAEVFEEATGEPPPPDEVEQTIAELPETVTGIEVTVADRLVTAVTVNLVELFGAADEPASLPEAAVLTLELSEHGAAPAVERPEGAVTVTAERLQELFAGFTGPTGLAPDRAGPAVPAAS